MKKLFTILLLFVCMLNTSVFASTNETSSDVKAHKIEKFLKSKYPTSPLIGYEHQIVESADKYGLDYRLYVAISGCESSFGLRYLRHTHNLTGIGSGIITCKSILDNIDYTHRLIATKNFYRRYRTTGRLEHLIYVWKGVPPFSNYISTFKWIFRKIEKQ